MTEEKEKQDDHHDDEWGGVRSKCVTTSADGESFIHAKAHREYKGVTARSSYRGSGVHASQ